jgi:HPt (histidine-containing phosphotransfer) domain-containing protein
VISALRRLGGADFLGEIADAFRAQARRLIDELQLAASADDPARFARLVDSLYSEAVNIGATRLCQALAMLRSVGASDLRDRGAGYVATLRRELDQLDAALDAKQRRT